MNRMIAGVVCALFGFFCAPGQAPGQEVWARMQEAARPMPPIVGRASVIDGDTIEIGGRRIRLQAIDAPESGQTCGEEGETWRCGQVAARALDEMIGGKTTICQQDPRDPEDRYGRVLAMCRAMGDSPETTVNLRLVEAGLAVAYVQYLDYRNGAARPHKAAYLAAEAAARTARRGMWAGPFMRPWEWRAARRPR